MPRLDTLWLALLTYRFTDLTRACMCAYRQRLKSSGSSNPHVDVLLCMLTEAQ